MVSRFHKHSIFILIKVIIQKIISTRAILIGILPMVFISVLIVDVYRLQEKRKLFQSIIDEFKNYNFNLRHVLGIYVFKV